VGWVRHALSHEHAHHDHSAQDEPRHEKNEAAGCCPRSLVTEDLSRRTPLSPAC
jgi:hypothetical protein